MRHFLENSQSLTEEEKMLGKYSEGVAERFRQSLLSAETSSFEVALFLFFPVCIAMYQVN